MRRPICELDDGNLPHLLVGPGTTDVLFTLDHPRPLCERPTGSRGAPADPRLTNPYFAQWAKDRVKAAEERLTDRREAAMKSGLPLALVAQ